MNREFGGIMGLVLLFFWIGGCVDQRDSASAREFADARSRLEQGLGTGVPTESAWTSKRVGQEVHVEATTECSGWIWKKQLTYARAWMSNEKQDGPITADGLDLSAWIQQSSGLFAGVDAESVVPSGKYAEAVLVVEGNRWSDPCGCVLVIGTSEALFRGTLMASRTICPESGDYRLEDEG